MPNFFVTGLFYDRLQISATVISYKYDALGGHVECNKSEGTWTRYSYDGLEVLRHVNSDGSTLEYMNGGELATIPGSGSRCVRRSIS